MEGVGGGGSSERGDFVGHLGGRGREEGASVEGGGDDRRGQHRTLDSQEPLL